MDAHFPADLSVPLFPLRAVFGYGYGAVGAVRIRTARQKGLPPGVPLPVQPERDGVASPLPAVDRGTYGDCGAVRAVAGLFPPVLAGSLGQLRG